MSLNSKVAPLIPVVFSALMGSGGCSGKVIGAESGPVDTDHPEDTGLSTSDTGDTDTDDPTHDTGGGSVAGEVVIMGQADCEEQLQVLLDMNVNRYAVATSHEPNTPDESISWNDPMDPVVLKAGPYALSGGVVVANRIVSCVFNVTPDDTAYNAAVETKAERSPNGGEVTVTANFAVTPEVGNTMFVLLVTVDGGGYNGRVSIDGSTADMACVDENGVLWPHPNAEQVRCDSYAK